MRAGTRVNLVSARLDLQSPHPLLALVAVGRDRAGSRAVAQVAVAESLGSTSRNRVLVAGREAEPARARIPTGRVVVAVEASAHQVGVVGVVVVGAGVVAFGCAIIHVRVVVAAECLVVDTTASETATGVVTDEAELVNPSSRGRGG